MPIAEKPLCYSALPTNREQKETIIENLRFLRKLLVIPISELSEAERALFMEPCLTEKRLIPNDVGKVLSMLSKQPALLELLRFFYKHRLVVHMSIANYDSLSAASPLSLNKLKILRMKLGHKNTTLLINLWLENNCPLYDLETLLVKLRGMDDEQIEDILSTRAGYINFIYGEKIKGIPLSDIPSYKEDILIYAITNKKLGFIKFVEDCYDTFSDLGPHSVLFQRSFYAKHLNINSLNARNLKDCKYMTANNMLFHALQPERTYTFEEIKALYGQPEQYYKLYAALSISSVDKRLITMKQLIKHKLLTAVSEDVQIDNLAEKLSQKPLSTWREQEFAHIVGLKPQDAVELLIYHTEIEKLIPQMKTRVDARLAVRNHDSAGRYDSICEMKADLVSIDRDWDELVKKMKFSEQFLEQNQELIVEFLCQNGASIATTYYNGLGDDWQREALRRIVTSELLGEFDSLKYHGDDLRTEIDYPINNAQKSIWMENAELAEGEVIVKECDDFYDTMLLGTIPQYTCLSYVDGSYKDCLLSSFDSNKKVLYAYVNGKTAARAIIRLTKGRFKAASESTADKSFTFVDLGASRADTSVSRNNSNGDYLVLFLEVTYTSGLSDNAVNQVRDLFVKLVEKKAGLMNALLVLSNSYRKCALRDYANTLFHIYISKSKAGAQYLDSLNGSAHVSDEGGYRANNFYIRSKDIELCMDSN